MILYFTATGNSLYVARQLDGELASIAQERLRADRAYKADAIGIVSPVFYHELPGPVKDFIRTSDFECDYFYIIGTYGAHHGGFAELTRRFMEEGGKQLDYVNTVNMVDNALPGYDIAEQLRIDPEKKVDEHIAAIAADVRARKRFVQPVTADDLAWHESVVARGVIAPSDDEPLYEVRDSCIGCKACAKVCPMNCIQVADGKARFRYADCAACMACIHACPRFAIRFAQLKEKNPGVHYRNPNVTLLDIIASNESPDDEPEPDREAFPWRKPLAFLGYATGEALDLL